LKYHDTDIDNTTQDIVDMMRESTDKGLILPIPISETMTDFDWVSDHD